MKNYSGEVKLYGLDLIPTGSAILHGQKSDLSDQDFIHIGRIPVEAQKNLEEHGFYQHDSYIPWVPSDLKLYRHYTEENSGEKHWDGKDMQEHDIDIFEMHPLYYKEYIKHFNYIRECLTYTGSDVDFRNKKRYFMEKKNYTNYINTRMVRFITNELSDRLTYEVWLNA